MVRDRILLKKEFRPEFLNRIDEILLFHVLTRDQIKSIVDLQMHEIAGRLREQSIEIELTDTAREYLADAGDDSSVWGSTAAPNLAAEG